MKIIHVEMLTAHIQKMWLKTKCQDLCHFVMSQRSRPSAEPPSTSPLDPPATLVDVGASDTFIGSQLPDVFWSFPLCRAVSFGAEFVVNRNPFDAAFYAKKPHIAAQPSDRMSVFESGVLR